jgi:hypothetical protein
MSYQLARHGVLAIYSGNEPSVMRLMPPLIITEGEVDFLLEAIDAAVKDLVAGVGFDIAAPSERTKRRPPRPASVSAS